MSGRSGLFRVVAPRLDQQKLESGIKDFVRFWLYKNKKKAPQVESFDIVVKELALPTSWQKDFLNSQFSIPWQNAGKLRIDETNVMNLMLNDFEGI